MSAPPPPPVAALAPQPCLVAASESINFVPKLLLSFPVPRMISQLRLESGCAGAGEEATAAACAGGTSTLPSASSSWQTPDIGYLVRGMQESAQQLLFTGSFSHFLHEQLRHEVVPLCDAHVSAAEGGTAHDPGDSCSAAHSVARAVATDLQRTLSLSVQRCGTLLEADHHRPLADTAAGASAPVLASGTHTTEHRVPLTRVPKCEGWGKSGDAAITVPASRRPAGVCGTWAVTSATPRDLAPTGATLTVPASAGRRRAGAVVGLSTVEMYKPRTGPDSANPDAPTTPSGGHHGRCKSAATFADFVRQTGTTDGSDDGVVCDVPTLLHHVAALPLQTHPFVGVTSAQLSACVVALGGSGTAVDSSTTESDGECGAQGLLWSVQAWLCCECLAHPRFPAEAVPAGLVGRLIDAFARLVRRVAAELASVPPDGDAAAAAAADEDGATTSSKHERHASATSRRGMAGAGGTATSLLPCLEQLRGFLRCFAALLCSRAVQLVCAADACRLEALCYRCIFSVTRSCSREAYVLFSAYTTDAAVHLYRCLSNRLREEGHCMTNEFIQRLPTSSEWLTHRSYRVNYDGRSVLPMTVTMLAAAQSIAVSCGVGASTTAEALPRQCAAWAGVFVHELLLRRASERDRAEETLIWTATVRVVEDLTDLLGVPEWPGADLLLRAFVHSLTQLCLGAEAPTTLAAESLRPLAVDVVAHVALKLFDRRQCPVSAAMVAELECLADGTRPNQGASRAAPPHGVSLPAAATLAAADQHAWERMRGGTGMPGTTDFGAGARILALMSSVYVAESELVASPSTTSDYAAAWFHVRAAQLAVWVSLQEADKQWIPQDCLGTLAQWQRPAGSEDVSAHWLDVCAHLQAISTQFSASMLSLRTRQTLMTLLLSVFHLKDAQGAPVPVSDAIQKRTLSYLARLTAFHPPLQRYLWPVARQCVRDESARVRESIVPLLLTMLHDSAVVSAASAADGVTTEAVSSLLCLLGDKSAPVVARTIAALDVFVTDDAHQCLFSSPHGASLLSFIQHKLLQLAAPDETDAVRHKKDIVRLFLHRWVVTLGDADGALPDAHAQLAKELVSLVVMAAPDYPHDIGDEHPLVQVLQGMHSHVAAHDPTAEATPSARLTSGCAAAATTVPIRRRQRGQCIDASRLLHVMRCAARSLWSRYNCFHSTEDAVACLAALRALAHARGEWVQPLAELLVQSTAYPPPASSPLAKAPAALGGALLHMCHTMHAMLLAPRPPLVSLDQLARSLTTLLSKYVGPYQQRVIVASCGALCTLITCGAKSRVSNPVNVPYLQLCYSLMNTYYTRVRGLLSTLATQPQSVAYTQRFLFLLSEFLRMYPGWRRHPPHPAIAAESADDHGAASAQHALAAGDGIMANTYQLLEDVLAHCGTSATQERVAVIVLRVVASLCVLDPTTYFHRAEERVRDALRSRDTSLQLQGLSLLSDFLKEEDRRVDAAAQQAAWLDTTSLILGTVSNGAEASDTSSHSSASADAADCERATEPRIGRAPRLRHGGGIAAAAKVCGAAKGNRSSSTLQQRATESAAAAASCSEEFNSGMSTWIFQRFHSDIARLGCGAANGQVRSLCMRLFQQAAHGGLLPPDKYVHVIVALAADVSAAVRQQASGSLTAHAERHEEVVGAVVGRGVVLAFNLHRVCGVNLIRSAMMPPKSSTVAGMEGHPGDATSGYSVHSTVYTVLHKRHRDSMVTTMVRFLYQESKAQSWCEGHAALLGGATIAAAAPPACPVATAPSVDVDRLHPVLFLCHVTVAVATLPFSHESDVLHALHQARAGLDFSGQAALESLRSRDTPSPTLTSSEQASRAVTLFLWKAVGAVLLHYLLRSLASEYRVTPAKLGRYRGRQHDRLVASSAPHPIAAPCSRDVAHGVASAELISRVEALVRELRPALQPPTGHTSQQATNASLHWLVEELEAALMTETTGGWRQQSVGGSAVRKTGRQSKRTRSSVASRATRGVASPMRRRRRRSLSSTCADSDEAGVEVTSSSSSSSSSSASTESSAEEEGVEAELGRRSSSPSDAD
ncbi:Sister chromatid cohesion C-terminus [Novymonas esmeraldas]|uniref:Sister chromatid cohesion protein n=1 Tax=Novymonas esmeraldas TaxID=1808958 RepID=A0AAW0F1G7_9TRYP